MMPLYKPIPFIPVYSPNPVEWSNFSTFSGLLPNNHGYKISKNSFENCNQRKVNFYFGPFSTVTQTIVWYRFNPYSAGIAVDVRFWRLMSIPAPLE